MFWHSPIPSDNHGVHEVKGDEEEKLNECNEKLDYLTTSTLAVRAYFMFKFTFYTKLQTFF